MDGEDGEMGVMRWIDNDGKLFSSTTASGFILFIIHFYKFIFST